MTKKHDIIWLDRVDSTNDEARRHISRLDNLSVLSAVEQTGGRGQRGNSWLSQPGLNLTFSIMLKFGQKPMHEFRAADQFAISQIASLSAIDLLSAYDIKAHIKWPNDIYADNRKICGMLIENSVRDGMLSSSIIGIGLNVNQTDFAPSLPNPISMALFNARKDGDSHELYSVDRLLEEFMDIFKGYYGRYLNISGGLARLRKLYLAQLWKMNEPATYIDTASGTKFNGIIRGLSGIGLLQVEDTDKGELKEFAFKEISFSI